MASGDSNINTGDQNNNSNIMKDVFDSSANPGSPSADTTNGQPDRRNLKFTAVKNSVVDDEERIDTDSLMDSPSKLAGTNVPISSTNNNGPVNNNSNNNVQLLEDAMQQQRVQALQHNQEQQQMRQQMEQDNNSNYNSPYSDQSLMPNNRVQSMPFDGSSRNMDDNNGGGMMWNNNDSMAAPQRPKARAQNNPTNPLALMNLPPHPGDKPKRPLSAYNFFFQLERERIISGKYGDARDTLGTYSIEDVAQIALIQQRKAKENRPKAKRSHRKTHGKISFADLARTIANKWKKLNDESKAIFEGSASIEKERYKKELSDWNRKQKKWKDATAKMAQLHQQQHGNSNASMFHTEMMMNSAAAMKNNGPSSIITPPQMPRKTVSNSRGGQSISPGSTSPTNAGGRGTPGSWGNGSNMNTPGQSNGSNPSGNTSSSTNRSSLSSNQFMQGQRRFSGMPFDGSNGVGFDDMNSANGNNMGMFSGDDGNFGRGGNGNPNDMYYDDMMDNDGMFQGRRGDSYSDQRQQMLGMHERRMRMMMMQRRQMAAAGGGNGGMLASGNSGLRNPQQSLMRQQLMLQRQMGSGPSSNGGGGIMSDDLYTDSMAGPSSSGGMYGDSMHQLGGGGGSAYDDAASAFLDSHSGHNNTGNASSFGRRDSDLAGRIGGGNDFQPLKNSGGGMDDAAFGNNSSVLGMMAANQGIYDDHQS